MSDEQEYFRRAENWATSTQAQATRGRRTAGLIAGVAVAVALLEAVALAVMGPLKTVQTVTILVDRQTGYVETVDPLHPRSVSADAALTNAFLAQYVEAREGFDRATIAATYRRTALWSGDRARASYLSQIAASNPASPFQRYPAGTAIRVSIKSVSRIGPGVALVRFGTQLQDHSGRSDMPRSWISVVRFRFVDAPMAVADRFINPLGFQVTGYQRDPETPPVAADHAVDLVQ